MADTRRPMNYTTTIPAAQTVGECQHILGQSGAAAVGVMFDQGVPCGLSFRLDTPHGRRDFTLPVNIDGIEAVLVKAQRDGQFTGLKKGSDKFTNRTHATMVAWRVVKDWLEANLALVAAQMATIDEVMLPYLHVGGDRTLWQAYRAQEAAVTFGESTALPPGTQ